VFSTTCYNHAQSENVHFNVESVSAGSGTRSTMNSMLNLTLQAFRAGKDRFPRVVERCEGLHCGSGCLQVEFCRKESHLCAKTAKAKPWEGKWDVAAEHAACRLDKSDNTRDGRGSAQLGPPGGTLESCKAQCVSQLGSHCHGVELHTISGRCELWTRPITHTKSVREFTCVTATVQAATTPEQSTKAAATPEQSAKAAATPEQSAKVATTTTVSPTTTIKNGAASNSAGSLLTTVLGLAVYYLH